MDTFLRWEILEGHSKSNAQHT